MGPAAARSGTRPARQDRARPAGVRVHLPSGSRGAAAGPGRAGHPAGSAEVSASGLPLDVERRGAGPPIVLLHGFGASRFTYRFWADDLARTHSLHLIDLVGFGAAPPPRTRAGYGPLEQAEFVLRYLRDHDLIGATLVGHSLGGGVALLVALRLCELGEQHRIAALVSVAGPAYAQAIPRYIGLARIPLIGAAMLRLIPTDRLVRQVLRYIVYDPDSIDAAQVEGYAAPLRTRRTRRAVVETARKIVPDNLDELAERFGEVRTPTLLLWGRHDHVIPLWVGQRLARDLPRARLVVLERCGHVPSEECPDESLAVVRSFLAEVDAGEPDALSR
ncbi:MAG: alpha/beta hydrolase [Gemmatimonadetes bacterium]|nr:alpha/beta hydrolase [Gemmatimonadota bacterium]